MFIAILAAVAIVPWGFDWSPVLRRSGGGAATGPTSVFRYAFATPGTYASPVADTGQTGTFTRASTKSCSPSAGNSLVQAASGSMCVESASSWMGIGGYLAEPASTNAVLQSSNLASVAWTQLGLTATANQGLFVDGTTTAALLADTSATAILYQQLTVSSSVGPWTESAWLSSITGTVTASIAPAVSGSFFTVGTCTCGTSNPAVPCTASIFAGGGSSTNNVCQASITATTTPTRVWATFTATAATTTVYVEAIPGVYNTSSGVSIYSSGAEFEASPFLTSYIPTTSTSVARVADVLSFASSGVLLGTAGSGSLVLTPEWSATTAGSGGSAQTLLTDSTGAFVVAYADASAWFQITINGSSTHTLTQSFAALTSHTLYWRYTTGGNTCIRVDAAAEVCAAGTTTFSPGATFYLGGSPSAGAGAWFSGVKLCISSFAPGGCT